MPRLQLKTARRPDEADAERRTPAGSNTHVIPSRTGALADRTGREAEHLGWVQHTCLPVTYLRAGRRERTRSGAFLRSYLALVEEEVLARLLLVGDELADGILGIGGAHQRLADQDGIDADPLELLDL